jgi:hypothetical protein
MAIRSMPMRAVRSIGLVTAGALSGFVSAALLAKQALPSRGDEESDEVALVAIFDGAELRSRATAFRGGSMLAWFGGVAVDLRDATLAPEAHLSITALLGGVAVRVPPGWRVESHARAWGGGLAIDLPEPEDPEAPTLVLGGFAFLGGIAVGARAAGAAFPE